MTQKSWILTMAAGHLGGLVQRLNQVPDKKSNRAVRIVLVGMQMSSPLEFA